MNLSASPVRAALAALSCAVLAAAPLRAQKIKSEAMLDIGAIKIEMAYDGLVHPWGLAFLPSGELLVTERPGRLRVFTPGDSSVSEPLGGVPEVWAEGQGGLLDVSLDPDFATNRLVYLTYAEAGDGGTAGTALGRGRLAEDLSELTDFETTWRQRPKLEGPNHFGSRIAWAPDGTMYVTTGERFKFDPAQDSTNTLGVVVRLNADGSIPEDNPYVGNDRGVDEAIWSFGHRNIQSAVVDPRDGKLWVTEMGPMGGDELNQPVAMGNYGWPVVSWGDNYDGSDIPDPTTHPRFADAVIHWSPTISPSGMLFYTGEMFPAWQGTALIGGLTASGLVRVAIEPDGDAEEVERVPLGARARAVAQGPEGAVWVLTDADEGKILRLRMLE